MAFQMQLESLLGNNTKYLSELKQSVARPLIQLAVKSIDQEYIEEGALELVSKNFNVAQSMVDEWYSAIFNIMKLHLRSPSINIKPPEFTQCLQEFKFTPECIQDILAVLTGPKRPNLLLNFAKRVEFFPHLVACKWRIDVVISSSTMSKVVQPYILMEWILSNGQSYVFELSVQRFHQLKYAIEKILLHLDKLETYAVIKNANS
ncbi:COMM domain-containing protein 5 [Copidosoma floridanum]|uniref:COMM domain-containing protein 5 n=1 Tax=Copidosoma floridanum TaxID=29053 RepID=UPI0006C982D6|nr:COMM domain-containing protein 5 [Copidosoma floridanum]XP_014205347.1 COMM domain-containing protein 5 [Copidosoma floridanum]